MPRVTPLHRFSPHEKLAFLLLDGDWLPSEMQRRTASLFRRKQDWIEPLLSQLLKSFPDRPRFRDLVNHLETHELFTRALTRRLVAKHFKRWFVAYPSLNWLDWQLPPFESEAQLASQFGITLASLDWLTGIDQPHGSQTDHYVRTWFKKRRAGYRLIESPKQRLKAVQRFLLQDILNWIPLPDAVTGFRAGRSVIDFVRPHVGNSVCLKMDLQDFFPSITARRVSGFFCSCGYDRTIARRLTRLTTTETPRACLEPLRPPGCRGSFSLSRLYLPAHLPQGAPTSPMLANLIAFHLDRRLGGLAESMNVVYTRYADDMLFSGDTSFQRQAKRFAETVASIAIEEGFQVNFHKTKVLGQSQRIQVAGIVINEKINLSRQVYERLKATLYNCIQQGPESQNRNAVDDFRSHLLGRINWARQLNPKKAEKLQRLFDQIKWPWSAGVNLSDES